LVVREARAKIALLADAVLVELLPSGAFTRARGLGPGRARAGGARTRALAHEPARRRATRARLARLDAAGPPEAREAAARPVGVGTGSRSTLRRALVLRAQAASAVCATHARAAVGLEARAAGGVDDQGSRAEAYVGRIPDASCRVVVVFWWE
jgi:hypothetical protein